MQALRDGELVAFPTETVYGLGANAQNPAAVRKIFEAKGRPHNHPVIVHLDSPRYLHRWVREVPELANRLAESFWPGPLTMVLPRAAHVHEVITGGQDTIAIRVPAHPMAQQLLTAFGGGIAAPSANRYGRLSPTRAEHVREEFGETVRVILDGGECQIGLESTIVSFEGEQVRLLRPGSVTAAQLREVVGELAIGAGRGVPARARRHAHALRADDAAHHRARGRDRRAGGCGLCRRAARRGAGAAPAAALAQDRHLDQRRPARGSLRARAVQQSAHARPRRLPADPGAERARRRGVGGGARPPAARRDQHRRER